jgi:DNA-binding transcriptional LysR family regulator
MIELRHIRYFIALAEERNFCRAAERLRIAQPGLSQQIHSLESQLGVVLLDRSKRPVQLTDAGNALLTEGRRALAEVERAIDFTRRSGRGAVGRLRIGAISSAIYAVLPQLLHEFRDRYPNVDLVLRDMTTPVIAQAMRNGELDVGLMRLPYDTGSFRTRTLIEEDLMVMVPEGHPLAALQAVPLRALAEQPLIVFPAHPRPSLADFVIRLCRQHGFEPNVVQEAIEGATVLSFVAANIGIALAPDSFQLLFRPGVVYRPVAPPTPKLPLALMYRSGEPSATVRALLAIVDELWPETSAADASTAPAAIPA